VPVVACHGLARGAHGLVWEGDWLMAGRPSFWDPIHAADPENFDAITP
jgi:hypothetical protein